MTTLPPPGSEHEHSVLHDLAVGAAVGATLAWLVKDERYPGLRLVCLVAFLPAAALAFWALMWAPSLLSLTGMAAGGWWVWTLPSRVAAREDARWLHEAQEAERAYQHGYMAKLAEVCSPFELARIGPRWDVPEQTYAEQVEWASYVERWFRANPSRYPSQDRARASGLLCRCEPTAGHSCARGDVVSLRALPVPFVSPVGRVLAWLRRDVRRMILALIGLPLVLWALLANWLLMPTGISAEPAVAREPASVFWALALLGAVSLCSSGFLVIRRSDLRQWLQRRTATGVTRQVQDRLPFSVAQERI